MAVRWKHACGRADIRARYLILSLLILICLSLLLWRDFSRGIHAVLMLADITAGENDSLLKKLTPTPSRSPITFRVKNRTYAGDLYRTGNESRAGLLLIPGAAEAGKDDPRLVALAKTLARERFTVLVPDLTGIRTLQVGSGNVREIAGAFSYLDSLSDGRSKNGIFAFSYAVGPALLASLEPEIRDQVSFMVAVGSYHDLHRVLTFFTTGYFQDEEGSWRHRNPNEFGKWFFVLSNVGRLSDPTDRRLFRLMAERKMEEPLREVDDLAVQLKPEGKQLYDFLVNRDPSRVSQLVGALPVDIGREINALNLANKDLSALRAQLILVHGLDDDIIPYTESVALAGAVPPGRAELFLAKGLFHVDVKVGFRDGWQLWRAVVALLEMR